MRWAQRVQIRPGGRRRVRSKPATAPPERNGRAEHSGKWPRKPGYCRETPPVTTRKTLAALVQKIPRSPSQQCPCPPPLFRFSSRCGPCGNKNHTLGKDGIWPQRDQAPLSNRGKGPKRSQSASRTLASGSCAAVVFTTALSLKAQEVSGLSSRTVPMQRQLRYRDGNLAASMSCSRRAATCTVSSDVS